MKKEIHKKYIENCCSEEEFEQFADWVNNDALSKEGQVLGFNDWTTFNPGETEEKKKYSTLLDKIHHQINLNEREAGKTLYFEKAISWLTRVAAVLFLPLLGVMFYLLSNNNIQSNISVEMAVDSLEIIAPIGSRTVVQLADGTEVNLNYGSRIKYPRVFTGDTREITLEGEGYFDVTHNPDKPFVVKTGKLDIKVLGTKFNVQAYSGQDVVSTTLVEGKVALELASSCNTCKLLGTMLPGQHVDYNSKSGTASSSKGNIEKYIAWKDGKLVFDNEPICGVAQKLSRMFNVDIEVAEDALDYSYTVTFVDEPLFLILDLMTETTPVTYKTFPRNKLPDGTYSKQKIRIAKRN